MWSVKLIFFGGLPASLFIKLGGSMPEIMFESRMQFRTLPAVNVPSFPYGIFMIIGHLMASRPYAVLTVFCLYTTPVCAAVVVRFLPGSASDAPYLVARRCLVYHAYLHFSCCHYFYFATSAAH